MSDNFALSFGFIVLPFISISVTHIHFEPLLFVILTRISSVVISSNANVVIVPPLTVSLFSVTLGTF